MSDIIFLVDRTAITPNYPLSRGFKSLVEEQLLLPGDATVTLITFGDGKISLVDKIPLAKFEFDEKSATDPFSFDAALGLALLIDRKSLLVSISNNIADFPSRYSQTLFQQRLDEGWNFIHLNNSQETAFKAVKFGFEFANISDEFPRIQNLTTDDFDDSIGSYLSNAVFRFRKGDRIRTFNSLNTSGLTPRQCEIGIPFVGRPRKQIRLE